MKYHLPECTALKVFMFFIFHNKLNFFFFAFCKNIEFLYSEQKKSKDKCLKYYTLSFF